MFALPLLVAGLLAPPTVTSLRACIPEEAYVHGGGRVSVASTEVTP